MLMSDNGFNIPLFICQVLGVQDDGVFQIRQHGCYSWFEECDVNYWVDF